MSALAVFPVSRVLPRWAEMNKEGRLAAVSALTAEGCTASGMAAKLDTTRNAVIGFCRRQGVALPGVSFKAARPRRQKPSVPGVALAAAGVVLAPQVKRFVASPHAAEEPPGAYSSATARSAEAGALLPLPPEIGAPADPSPEDTSPEDLAPAAPSGGISFHALTDQHCKRPLWPDGPVPRMDAQRFCGGRVEPGLSWCPGCARMLLAGAPQPQRHAWRGT